MGEVWCEYRYTCNWLVGGSRRTHKQGCATGVPVPLVGYMSLLFVSLNCMCRVVLPKFSERRFEHNPAWPVKSRPLVL